MKEREFQAWVVDVFKTHGWDVKHSPTPMRPIGGGRWAPDPRGRGILDLKMTHTDPPRIVFAECKNETGEISVEQAEELRRLRLVAEAIKGVWRAASAEGPAPFAVYVFQPANRDLIEAVARGASA